jgi:hypothetical protein
MVAVGVGDHSPVNRLPGIYEEITGFAVETAGGEGEEGHAGKYCVSGNG